MEEEERMESDPLLLSDRATTTTTTTTTTNSNIAKRWKVLLFGQVVALTAALVNASSFALTYNYDISLPFSQMFVMYLFLSFFLTNTKRQRQRHQQQERKTTRDNHQHNHQHQYNHQQPATYKERIPLLHHHQQHTSSFMAPWWAYLCVSIVDVQANWLFLTSLRYTNLTSTTLLGSLTIPSTMIMGRLLLSKTFSLSHFIGVSFCIIGGTMTVWLDVDNSSMAEPSVSDNDTASSSSSSSSSFFLGDVLAVSSATIYGFGDSVAEFSIKRLDRFEYLGFIGLFGAIQTGAQAWFWERHQILDIVSSISISVSSAISTPIKEQQQQQQLQAASIFLFYIIVLFYYYVWSTAFLIDGDATLMNLSLQVSPFWAILFVVAAEGQRPTLSFYTALLLIIIGVFIYEVMSHPTMKNGDGDGDDQHHAIDNGVLVRGDDRINQRDEERPLNESGGYNYYSNSNSNNHDHNKL